ncbi:RING finger and transmembrane domain-containing protein 2 [Euphorbia peplus]|nr:RING finger and transmembrane domain-containing protein 2 [Euphorbia peplus]
MEASGTNSDVYRGSSGGSSSPNSSNSRRYGTLSASSIIQAPISALLEYSGLLRRSTHHESDPLIVGSGGIGVHNNNNRLDDSAAVTASNSGEVAIRIIGAGEHDHERDGAGLVVGQSEVSVQQPVVGTTGDVPGDSRSEPGTPLGTPQHPSSADGEGSDGSGANGRDSSYQRYDIQQAARWIEQVLPFSLLLLVVFIRQHLQGFFVTIWIAVVMFKSNDILRKQTALKGERKISVLVGISLAFTLHVVCVYWWYQNDDLLYPLVMLPPKSIPPFWHAIFIIMVNDTLVRQAAMVLKCLLLMYYKNSRGRNYRKQGQLLTLVEYLMLLYRALLPTPVWYRFFLNKEYGSLFSSLMTGLYLTFKLTSVVEKVQSFFSALKALSRKEVHYGAYATSEQVNAAGDLCAICQEKMHAPILLRCKHIFCEDCVSEWFERERTCPLCRALVKPADLRSFGDGSTTLFFQIF